MSITPPENNVEIRSNDHGGVRILLDGYDLAPHVESWRVNEDAPGDGPALTVTIPCGRVVMDVAEPSVTGSRPPKKLHEEDR